MSFTDRIKNYILYDCKMDAVGIAPASALDDEEPKHRPEYLLPGARSIIVFTKRIPDGVIQGGRLLELRQHLALPLLQLVGGRNPDKLIRPAWRPSQMKFKFD